MDFSDEIAIAHQPDGTLNAPYLLANARTLEEAGEIELAVSLYRLVRTHPKLGYCGYYGMGQCWASRGELGVALSAYEKALVLCPRPFIALRILETLARLDRTGAFKSRAIEMVQQFSADIGFSEKVQRIFRESLERSRGP